jgi:hypothetical protein
MGEDFTYLEFMTLNSKEIIEKQVGFNRQQRLYATTIICFTVLFTPFF